MNGVITYQEESFKALLPELKPLLHRHWNELALNKDKVPLDPRYDIYFDAEDRGELLYFTVRMDSDLIGYFIGFISPELHYKTCLTCKMDIFYIDPNYRGHGIGKDLFRCVEKVLKKRGVKRLYVGTKLHKDASFLFKKLEYTEIEHYYMAWLGE